MIIFLCICINSILQRIFADVYLILDHSDQDLGMQLRVLEQSQKIKTDWERVGKAYLNGKVDYREEGNGPFIKNYDAVVRNSCLILRMLCSFWRVLRSTKPSMQSEVSKPQWFN